MFFDCVVVANLDCVFVVRVSVVEDERALDLALDFRKTYKYICYLLRTYVMSLSGAKYVK